MSTDLLRAEFTKLKDLLWVLYESAEKEGINNPNFINQFNRAYSYSVMTKEEFNDGKITSEYNLLFGTEICKLSFEKTRIMLENLLGAKQNVK